MAWLIAMTSVFFHSCSQSWCVQVEELESPSPINFTELWTRKWLSCTENHRMIIILFAFTLIELSVSLLSLNKYSSQCKWNVYKLTETPVLSGSNYYKNLAVQHFKECHYSLFHHFSLWKQRTRGASNWSQWKVKLLSNSVNKLSQLSEVFTEIHPKMCFLFLVSKGLLADTSSKHNCSTP